jgi:hypothetical protein
LQKNPLRPFVIRRIGRVDFAFPIIGKAETLNLSFKVRDILRRNVSRMNSRGLVNVAPSTWASDAAKAMLTARFLAA